MIGFVDNKQLGLPNYGNKTTPWWSQEVKDALRAMKLVYKPDLKKTNFSC